MQNRSLQFCQFSWKIPNSINPNHDSLSSILNFAIGSFQFSISTTKNHINTLKFLYWILRPIKSNPSPTLTITVFTFEKNAIHENK